MGGWVIGNKIPFYSIFLPTGYNYFEVKYGHTGKAKKQQRKLSAVSCKHFGILFDRFKYFADGITLPTKSSHIHKQMRLLIATFILLLCLLERNGAASLVFVSKVQQ